MSFWNPLSWFGHQSGDPFEKTRGLRDSIAKQDTPTGSFMSHQKDIENALSGSFKKGGPVKKTGIYRLHKGEYVLNRKQAIAKKMNRNDSDSIREFSRINPDTGRPLFRMSEGNYKRQGDRYVRDEAPIESMIHG
jgi:hypothetical protein